MRVFVAGATGAIGKRMLPMLVESGHTVFGATRSAQKTGAIRAAGAEPVVVDAFDAAAISKAVERARPDAVIHELTAIPDDLNLKKFGEQFQLTNRLRTEGTDHLLAAALSAGVRRFIAQSFACWNFPPGVVPPAAFRETIQSLRYVETAVTQTP